jgi:hypothetical protein
MLSLTRWSSQIHAGFHGPGATRVSSRRSAGFVYGAITLCGASFQCASTTCRLFDSSASLVPGQLGPTTPDGQRHQAVTPIRFRLFPFRSPLLGESLLLSFPRGTEMCQFPRFPLPALCVQTGVTPRYGCRVSPFGHPRVNAQSAALRGLSQPLTSFIGVRRQGIHHWPFVAWDSVDRFHESKMIRCSCSLCSSQGAPARPPRAGGTHGFHANVPPRTRRVGTERSFKAEQRTAFHRPQVTRDTSPRRPLRP